MFKSLIATCLLTFSCSNGLQVNHNYAHNYNDNTVVVDNDLKPKKAYGGNNYLYGAYCLTDETIDFDYLTESGYNFAFEFDSSIRCAIYNYIDDTHFVTYEPSDVYSINFNCNTGVGFSFVSFSFTDNFDELIHGFVYNNLVNFDTLTGSRCVPQRLMFYFEQPYYFEPNSEVLYVFNTFFTQLGNIYNTVYTGWYTLNDPYNNSDANFSLFGNFLVGNMLAEQVVFSPSFIGIRTFTQEGIYYVYDNGTFVGNARNVYLTGCMIPRTSHTSMLNFGVFSYTPTDIHDYTFGELVFQVMDAPVLYLKSLFSFDLFGQPFYIAFMSILTIMLICFVVRKII